MGAALHQAVRLRRIGQRQYPVDHRADDAGLEQGPDVLADRGDDRGLFHQGPGAQPGAEGAAAEGPATESAEGESEESPEASADR